MDKFIEFLLADTNVYLPISALAIGFLMSIKDFSLHHYAKTTLPWFCFFVIGVGGLHGFIFHVFFADFTAQQIGWASSPFQYEVGIANLVFAALGLFSIIKRTKDFYFAMIIGFFVWFVGDGVGHVYQLLIRGDTAQFNAGSIMYTDFICPVVAFLLYGIAYSKDKMSFPELDDIEGF